MRRLSLVLLVAGLSSAAGCVLVLGRFENQDGGLGGTAGQSSSSSAASSSGGGGASSSGGGGASSSGGGGATSSSSSSSGCVDPSIDCPPQGTACVENVCSGSACATQLAAAGAACADGGGKICDGDGACVQCLTSTDCGGSTSVCTGNVCAAPSCADGQKDGTETDTDCGGSCAPCAAGKACGVAADCASQYCPAGACAACTSDSQCASSFCSSGACVAKSPPGVTCTKDAHCQSNHCVDGVCCSSTCTGQCLACNVAGSQGTCGSVPAGTSDPGTCPSPSTCDSGGNCRQPNGYTCVGDYQCQSMRCADGYCCNAKCAQYQCKACNLPGKLGLCDYVPAGQSDPDTCPSPKVCSGMGACQ